VCDDTHALTLNLKPISFETPFTLIYNARSLYLRPQIPSPKLQTQHPKLKTRIPNPKSQSPKPYTLNPIPYTLNPKP
jgi:hypothetical protein